MNKDFNLELSPEELTIILAYISCFVKKEDTPEFCFINRYVEETCEVWMRYNGKPESETYDVLRFELPKMHTEIPPDAGWQDFKFYDEETASSYIATGFANSMLAEAMKPLYSKA